MYILIYTYVYIYIYMYIARTHTHKHVLIHSTYSYTQVFNPIKASRPDKNQYSVAKTAQ